MIGESFLRDFFGMERTSTHGLTDTYGVEVVQKALELCKGCDPHTNVMPFIQIVLDAKRLGLEVKRLPERR